MIKPTYHMDQSLEAIANQAEELYQKKEYESIVALLNDEVLKRHNDSELYLHKARALNILEKPDDSLIYSRKALSIDPKSTWGWLTSGNSWCDNHKYDKAIQDYNKAIELDAYYGDAYINLGNALSYMNDHDKAIEAYNKAINLDGNDADAYNNRGNVWYKAKNHDKSIEDYNKAIELKPDFPFAYHNRGLTWQAKEDYKNALTDFDKAIQLDKNYARAYHKRAEAYSSLGEYKKAIVDYQSYVKLKNNPDDYFTKVALSEIARLQENIENEWYIEIEQNITKIKQLLLFDRQCITHYTSLSAAKAMILDESFFRLSEGAYLNDTSEGKELLKYMEFEIPKSIEDGTIEEYFTEKPFIGSFVADNKHNDLTLWRMYGKEAQVEARGCALTIDRKQFINDFEAILNPVDSKESKVGVSEGKYTFYKVAYRNGDKFSIPGSGNKSIKQLKELLRSLKESLKELNKEQKERITELLNDITYLFKSAEYQYENEIRLVVQGVGITKKFEDSENSTKPPRVHIDMINITPALKKITLGPKVERADEWAAAFNYYIKENYTNNVDIVISHLPFK